MGVGEDRPNHLDTVKGKAHQLRTAGEWGQLAEFLDSVQVKPALNHNLELVLLRAEAALRLGEPHQTVQFANEVLADQSGALAPSLRARALLVRASASRLRGFPEAALRDASDALAILQSDSGPVEPTIEAHRQLGIALGMAGELDKAIQHLERALELCARSPDLTLFAAVHAALGTALGQMGQLSESLVHFNNARAAREKLGDKVQLSDVLNNLGQVYFLLSQYDSALNTLQKGLQFARETGYRRTEAIILITTGDTLKQMGRYEEALASYFGALQPAAEALEPRLVCCANGGIGSVYCTLGDFKKASMFLDQAAYEAERLGLRRELAGVHLSQGILECNLGNYPKAEEKLLRGIELLEKTGTPAGLARGYLNLAAVYSRTKRWTRLKRCLETLAKLVHQLDLLPELLREGSTVPEVIAYAASKRVGGYLFSEARAALMAAHDQAISGVITPAGASAAAKAGYPTVKANSLGRAEVYVDGRLISGTEWESQKAKELFYYLLCNRPEKSREQLLEILWPEVSVGLSRNAFYNNVYRTRRALYKESIVQDGGRYKLNPEGDFRFDLEEFQRLVREAERLPSGSEERASLLSHAIKLYRGAFLEEFYSEWSDAIRLEAEAQYLRSLARLAGYHAARGEYDTAFDLLETLLHLDQGDVEAHELLIKLLLRRGDIAQARQRYRQYAKVVANEMSQESLKSFQDLYRETSVSP